MCLDVTIFFSELFKNQRFPIKIWIFWFFLKTHPGLWHTVKTFTCIPSELFASPSHFYIISLFPWEAGLIKYPVN